MATAKKLPGQVELEVMCENARRVAQLCDVLGFEFRGARPLLSFLEELQEREVESPGYEDGAWILPESWPGQQEL